MRGTPLLALALALAGVARAEPPGAPPQRPPDVTLLRVDVEDGFALHPWIYHELRLSERWGVLFDAHAQTPGKNDRFPPFVELDLGPVLHVGGLQVNPQLGIDLAWRADPAGGGRTRVADVIFELYLIYSLERLNVESWNLYFIPLDADEPQLYLMRQLLNVRLVAGFALGPHVEGAFVRGKGVERVAVGGDLLYTFRFGQLGLFLAAERMRGVLEMRLTFIREL
jgi:hypothetical protein